MPPDTVTWGKFRRIRRDKERAIIKKSITKEQCRHRLMDAWSI